MDHEERVVAFLKEHALAAGLGVVGVISLGVGIVGVLGGSKGDAGIVFEESVSNFKDASESAKIVIDVAGAVEKPGVYELEADARIQDALILAGGMSEDADRQRIAQEINLAAPLTDGGKLYIPFIDETAGATSTRAGSSTKSSQATLGTNASMININTASETELDTLPGIGPVTAQKIIDNRPYQSIEELLEKKAVGESVFEKIKEQVSVY